MSKDKDLMKDLDALLADIQGKPAPKQEVRIRRPAPKPVESTEVTGVETKESEGGFTPPDPSLLDPNSRNHFRNKGRESLFDLEPNKLYFVEGLMSGVYETNRETNIRIAVKDVIVKPYRVDMRYDEIPVVAFATHINSIRKRQGLEYLDLSENKRNTFIGKLESYVTAKCPEVERRSFKLLRDSRVDLQLRNIEQRVRKLNSEWDSLPPEDKKVRANKTLSLARSLFSKSIEYVYVPYFTEKELQERCELAKRECAKHLKALSIRNNT